MSNSKEFEIPDSMREMAEKSIDQAQDAYDKLMKAMQDAQSVLTQSTDVVSNSAKSVQEQTIEFAQANVDAGFELANKLVQAKDLKEAIELQSEYAQSQMKTYLTQTKKLTDVIQKSVKKAQSK